MNRRPLHRPLALVSLLLGLAVVDVRADGPAQPAARTWQHPAQGYAPSVRRWFLDLPPELQYSELRLKAGDDARWAQPDWADLDWPVCGFLDLPARAGMHWARFRVRLGADGRGTLPAGIMISTVRAYELYWDGVQLGANGRPGMNRDGEQVGLVDAWFSIPAALRGPGEHVVALRTSSYRVGFPARLSGFRLLVDEPAVLQGKVLREAFVPTLAAGALCMVALAAGIMWLLAARRATLLLLGGVCLAGAAMQGMQAARWFYHYPADWHYPVLTTMVLLVGVQGTLMVAFVLTRFQVPGRPWLLSALVPVLGLISWLSPERINVEGLRILAVAFAVSLGCAGWAVWRRRRGAWPVALGVAASALLLLLDGDDIRVKFFLNFLPALLGLITSLALQAQDERRHAREAKLTAARMEIELLKKNLQPHFLLNTLTAVSEVIEHDPAGAVTFIDDLAAVFRSLAAMTGERLVPLRRELELCVTHLKVVGRRLGRNRGLRLTGTEPDILVPPALILTLLENGLVYQLADEGADFRLSVRSAAAEVNLRFLSPGRRRDLGGRPVGGTGLRYVKARLEESFPGQWTLTQGEVAEGWETVIVWRGAAAEGGAA